MEGGSEVSIKVLVACEESQAVTIEFRKLGIEAYSCDLLPCSGGHPEWHFQEDVLEVMKADWTAIFAFPPCTHLAVSGSRHFPQKRLDGRQRDAIDFFMQFKNSKCKHTLIENPIGIISGQYIGEFFPDIYEKYSLPFKPSQIIQPFNFGDPVKKTTCVWLKNLPMLKHTEDVQDQVQYYTSPKGKKMSEWNVRQLIINGKKYGYNTDEFKKHRSKTFPGIAKAIATQHGNYLKELYS